METLYNMRSPAVRRLMKEAQELSTPTEEYFAQPVEDNLFEWHFTVRGPPESEFDGGVYHGRIILPPEYPMKPPSIILLTPNGRFEVTKKICLSISGHHPESWQPSWSIRTALLALIGFMPTHGGGAIGSLDYSPEERKALAKKSKNWSCCACGCISSLINDRSGSPESAATCQEAKELAAQISFKGEVPGSEPKEEKPTPPEGNASPVSGPRQDSSDVVPPSPSVPQHQQDQQQVMAGTASQSSIWTTAIWVLTLAIAVLVLRRVVLL